MRIRLFYFICLFLLPSSSLACDICTPKIAISQPLASCFLERLEGEIERLKQSGLPVAFINLASCDGVETATRGGQGMSRGFGSTQVAKPDVSFLLDEAGLKCLERYLARQDLEWNPLAIFEPSKECAAQ